MGNPRYQKESLFSNLEYRYKLLKEELSELVLSLLPENEDEQIVFLMEDDAGNNIERISRTTVYGDGGLTEYPFEELTIKDLLQIAYPLINELPTEE